jgi:UDP-glucose 4-epimerase
MNILVTGGAGYIGSHTVKILLRKNYRVISYDNLENGHQEALRGSELVIGDLADQASLDQTFKKYKIEAIIHFAAYASVPESVSQPAKYFQNNLINGLNLLELARLNKVKKIVFSSSASVYGEPKKIPIKEQDLNPPTNPYGLTKRMFEQILSWYDQAYGMKSVSLRYFCAAGADPEGKIGEDHRPETHLIPLVLLTALGKKEAINIYGTNYPTPDGTCVRDFIHVNDLAQAHLLALKYLSGPHPTSKIYNCGIGQGYSVRKVIETAKKVTGKNIKVIEEKPRPGDPSELVADPTLIKKELSWKPEFPELETMIETAWNWYQKHPEGYGK